MINKAVISVAGLGTRFLPMIKSIPKEMLPMDDIIVSKTPCTKRLIDNFNKYGRSTLAVEAVPMEKTIHYGIIKGNLMDDSLYVLDDIVEKPKPEDAPSNMGAIGRYVLTPEIFDCIKETTAGVGNEIQLTDGIRLLSKIQKVYAYKFTGKRYDTGDKTEYVKAIVDFALNNDSMKDSIKEYLASLNLRG